MKVVMDTEYNFDGLMEYEDGKVSFIFSRKCKDPEDDERLYVRRAKLVLKANEAAFNLGPGRLAIATDRTVRDVPDAPESLRQYSSELATLLKNGE